MFMYYQQYRYYNYYYHYIYYTYVNRGTCLFCEEGYM